MKIRNFISALFGLGIGSLALQKISRPSDIRWTDYADELHHPLASKFIVINGVRLHYQEAGISNKSTLVLIHGFCSSNYTWEKCLLPLADAGYHVIAPDLKGFGFSEKPRDCRYHAQDQAQLIVGLLDKLNIKSAIFCGNSYGGAISLASALMWPNIVEKLILINSVYNDFPFSKFKLSLARFWGIGEVAASTLFRSHFLIQKGLQNMFYDFSLVTKEKVKSYWRYMRTSNCQESILKTARQWDLNWIEKELDLINIPTLVLGGEQDRVIPLPLSAQLHLLIPNSQFIVFPHCGHLLQEECPVETTSMIVNFINYHNSNPVSNSKIE